MTIDEERLLARVETVYARLRASRRENEGSGNRIDCEQQVREIVELYRQIRLERAKIGVTRS